MCGPLDVVGLQSFSLAILTGNAGYWNLGISDEPITAHLYLKACSLCLEVKVGLLRTKTERVLILLDFGPGEDS